MSLKIYNIGGLLVRSLVDETLPGGRHEVDWRGDDVHGKHVASGVYMSRLVAEGSSFTRKLTVAK